MKVFAHYLGTDTQWNQSIDGFQYRWRTILQFGKAWDIIGSVIMKNPGSAKPLQDNITEEELNALSCFDKSGNQWYRFTADNTMHLIEKLFIERNSGKPLDGVVQIFNLFNIRNADLDKALKNCVSAKETVISTIYNDIEAIRQCSSPIYIGWGTLGLDPRFKEQAKIVFQFVRNEMNQNYLFPKYEDNRFYHPQYLMGRGKNKPISKGLLKAFCQNSYAPFLEEVTIPNNSTTKTSEIQDKFKHLSVNTLWYENIRYEFYPGLQVTFDKTTINIRFTSRKDNGFLIANYQSDHELRTINILLNEFGYAGPEKVWIGRKKFSVFGNSPEVIASKIKSELDLISETLKNKGIELCKTSQQ